MKSRSNLWCVVLTLVALMGLGGCEEDQSPATADGYLADTPDLAFEPDASADFGPMPDAMPPPFTVLPVDGDPEPLFLGVWGDEAGGVWFAGGSPEAEGGLMARLEGDEIRPVATPPGPALWWVWGADADHVWACGAAGRILRWKRGRWITEETGLPDSALIWGLWGSSATDLWAVGGSPRIDGPRNLVLRSSGDGVWTRVDDPALVTDPPMNLYKVWGAGPDEVYLVGEGGLAFVYDGETFTRVDAESVPDLLFTAHGQPGGPILAVGGLNSGRVVRWDGEAWVDDEPPPLEVALNGVFVEPGGRALVSGESGALLAREPDGVWRSIVPPGTAVYGPATLHAVWSGEHIWAVGGRLQRGFGGVIATDRRPLPTYADLSEVPDAGLYDAGPPDAAPDASAPDARVPDALVPDAAASDAVAPDAATPDAEIPDAEIPDAEIPDAEIPDAMPPDMDLRPGAGEACDANGCAGELECLGIFDSDRMFVGNYCVSPCFQAEECGPEFGPGVCCEVPGPQLFQPYCIPPMLLGGACPQ